MSHYALHIGEVIVGIGGLVHHMVRYAAKGLTVMAQYCNLSDDCPHEMRLQPLLLLERVIWNASTLRHGISRRYDAARDAMGNTIRDLALDVGFTDRRILQKGCQFFLYGVHMSEHSDCLPMRGRGRLRSPLLSTWSHCRCRHRSSLQCPALRLPRCLDGVRSRR